MCLIVPQNVSGYSPKMKIKGLTPALSVNKNSNEYTAVHIVPTGVGGDVWLCTYTYKYVLIEPLCMVSIYRWICWRCSTCV
jgi:hypothetical protein